MDTLLTKISLIVYSYACCSLQWQNTCLLMGWGWRVGAREWELDGERFSSVLRPSPQLVSCHVSRFGLAVRR